MGGDEEGSGSGLNPDVGPENWAAAEEAAEEVVCCVHSTLDSEEKRKDVIDYVQRLIRTSLGCEVFPYGSVPLKTYLPDGDIDLTALSCPVAEDTLARDVLAVLQGEEHNPHAECEVKDTQFIDAEVKLVKCLVQNIVIDLSFNQLGGLCTLCFLEQVDRLVGKNHLFKRSIILIKTWCYYESRILGAHHGLISTYAMETLVLYIFHLFHASLDGPLGVLYKFLDYFSKFDWDDHCISLKGPVSKSCLPDLVVDKSHSMQNDYMLSEEFLSNCIDMFSVPSRGAEVTPRAFPPKHLNIIDPLKENNNLGRSVNKGNFYRIRSAFRFGARKLRKILLLPRERIADEIKSFFANTLERHGSSAGNLNPLFHSRSFSEEKIRFNSLSFDSTSYIPGRDYVLDRCSSETNYIPMGSRIGQPTSDIGVLVSLPAGEVNSRLANHQVDCSASSWYLGDSVSQYYTPSLNLSETFEENGKFNNWMFTEEKPAVALHEKMHIESLFGEHRDNQLRPCSGGCYLSNNYEHTSSFGSEVLSPDGSISDDLSLDFREKDLVDIGSPENSNPLSDLTGDYDSHIRSLLYGQCCHGYALSAPMPNPPPTFASQFESNRPWNTASRSMPVKQNFLSNNMVRNGMNLGWTTNPINIPTQSNPALCLEEKHKPRGTGTYLPVNGCLCLERPSRGRGKYRSLGNHHQYQRSPHRTGSASVVSEKKSSEEGINCEQQPKVSASSLYDERTKRPQQSTSPAFDEPKTSTFAFNIEKLEFGSLGNLSGDKSLRAPDSASGWGSTSSPGKLEMQNSESLFGNNHERGEKQSYRLKDEDFPPLTV